MQTKMEWNLCTPVEKISSSVYSWKLGKKGPHGRWWSGKFFLCGNRGVCNFQIAQAGIELGKLYLARKQGDEMQSLDVHISLRYMDKTEEFERKNIKYSSHQLWTYFMGYIKTEGLVEIKCTFLNIKEFSRGDHITSETTKSKRKKITDLITQQITPAIYFWKVGVRKPNSLWHSEIFSLCGKRIEFRFRILETSSDDGYFYLYQQKGDEKILLDVHVRLRYKDGTKEVKRKSINVADFTMLYYLGHFKTKDLLLVICIFSNIQEFGDSDLIKESCNKYYEEDIEDELIERESDHEQEEIKTDHEQDIEERDHEQETEENDQEEEKYCGNEKEESYTSVKYIVQRILPKEIESTRSRVRGDKYYEADTEDQPLETESDHEQEEKRIDHEQDLEQRDNEQKDKSDHEQDLGQRNHEQKEESRHEQETKENDHEKVENFGNEKEESSISVNDIEESILPKEIESTRSRGEIVLIENLKDAFLHEEDSDVILRVGDKQYPAHKFIIRARSPVFHAMLKCDMIERKQDAIDIEDCDPYIFRDFLLYLYTGKLENMTNGNVFELFHISDKYDVKELRQDCREFIQNNLNIDSICGAILLATRHCERVLLTQATTFFIDNIKDIITTVNWQEFVQENPIEANELFIKAVTKIS